MKRAPILFAFLLIAIVGCRPDEVDKPVAEGARMSASAEPVETTTVKGFDPEGEPEIQRMSDGSLRVVFNFMPPSYVEDSDDDLGPFATFDKDLEKALGVPVKWDDREVFLISKPQADTAAKVKAFLESYPKPK